MASSLRPVAFVPRVSRWDQDVGGLSNLLASVIEQRDARRTSAQKQAEERLRLLVDISQTWGAGEWERHAGTLKSTMEAAGYDPQLSDMFVEGQRRAAREKRAPDEAMRSLFGGMSAALQPGMEEAAGPLLPGAEREMLATGPPRAASPFEALHLSLANMLQTDPEAFGDVAGRVGNLGKALSLPGEQEALGRSLFGGATPESQNYQFLAPLVGRDTALQIAYGTGENGDQPASIEEFEYLMKLGADTEEAIAIAFGTVGGGEIKPPSSVATYELLIARGWDPQEAKIAAFPSLKPERAGGPKLTAQQLKDMHNFRKSEEVFMELSRLAQSVFTNESAIGSKLMALPQKGAAALNLAPQISLYESRRAGLVPIFARALGHTGVLTEIDVQRTESLFPKLGDSMELAQLKLESLHRLMSRVQEVSSLQLTDPEGANAARADAQSIIVEIETANLGIEEQDEGFDFTLPLSEWTDEMLDAYEPGEE